MTGTYGLTKVVCDRVDFHGSSSPSYADYRAWVRVVEVIKEVIVP
jgi:hypothetical protein